MFLQRPNRGSSTNSTFAMRAVAVLCLLLFTLTATAQVCHIHPSDNRAGAPDHCPLCMAMHSAALPTAAQSGIALTHAVQKLVVAQSSAHVSSLWSFELSSRPPPSVS